MKNGLKQGCPLSPILFNLALALDPLITQLDKLDLHVRAYCDDIALGFIENEPLISALARITSFNRATGMSSNVTKTRYITTLFFKAPPRLSLLDHWKQIEESQTYRYLGVLMGNKITVNDVFSEAWTKISQRVASYMPFKNYYNTQTRVIISNSFLSPIFSYLFRFYLMGEDFHTDAEAPLTK